MSASRDGSSATVPSAPTPQHAMADARPVELAPPLVVLVSFTLSAFSSRLLRWITSMRAAGLDVQVLVPDDVPRRQPLPASIEPVRTTLVRMPIPLPLAQKFVQARWRQRRLTASVSRQPALVLATDPDSLPTAREIARTWSVPLAYDVQEYHDDVVGISAARRAWVARAERRAIPRLAALFALSEHLAKDFADRHPRAPTPLILPNYQPAVVRSDAGIAPWSARLGLPSTTRLLLYHGQLSAGRGLELLAETAVLLPADWHTVCLGWGPLADVVAQRGQGRLTVMPAVAPDLLVSTIRGASLGAVLFDPTPRNHRHADPNKFYEYAAAGIPVLTRSDLQLADTVADEDIGLVACRDPAPADLAALIASFEPAEQARLASRARAWSAARVWETAVAPANETLCRLANLPRQSPA